jgi:hypothetical protein
LWRFEELMMFSSDQALFMSDIWEMVQEGKLKLVGPIVTTQIMHGRGFFTGPLFYYLLIPLAILTRWDVILMTKIFMGIWWLTGAGLFFWIGKSKGWLAGISAFAIYSVFPYLLDFNRLLWNPSLLPFLGIFLFAVMNFLWQKPKPWLWFVLGMVVGLGINLHYGAILWGLIVLGFWFYGLWRKHWVFWTFALFIFGVLMGDLPLVIFELRHNFYNLSTIILFLSGRGSQEMKGWIRYYHFLFPLLPLVFWVWGMIISFLQKKSLVYASLLSVLVFLLCFFSIDWQKEEGLGMPKKWNVFKQKQVAKMICEEIGDYPFEVASIINGDTRATDLRWWLGREGCQPLGVEEYNQAVVLYLVAPESRPPEKETIWEIQSLRPFKVEKEIDLGDSFIFYKLRRLPY